MPSNHSHTLAVFDLDGTLIRGDCFLPFIIGYSRTRRKYGALATVPIHVGLYATRLIRDSTAKERVLVSALRGESKSRVEEYAGTFCEHWVRPRLIESVQARLREHLSSGHRVVLLSASPEIYVVPIARMLEIPEVVCTRIRSEGDTWTGRLDGANCKGAEKVTALQRHLGVERWPGESWGYGDSKSDYPVLRWVSEGYLVSRNGELSRIPRQ